jgi:hypothetical protein
LSVTLSVQEGIIQKAWEDSEFKKQLIENPKAALKEAFGINVPDSIKLNILKETDTNLYFVLPQNPAAVKNESNVEGAAWQ